MILYLKATQYLPHKMNYEKNIDDSYYRTTTQHSLSIYSKNIKCVKFKIGFLGGGIILDISFNVYVDEMNKHLSDLLLKIREAAKMNTSFTFYGKSILFIKYDFKLAETD